MLGPDLLLPFLEPLEALGLPYMLTGSVAGILYGEPRLTHDVDIVVALRRADATRIVQAFPGNAFYCPPEEVIIIEVKRGHRGHFNLIHHETGFKADIYIAHDELHRWALASTRRIRVGQIEANVAPPEYVILRKLEYYRDGRSDKHLTDIRSILDVSGDLIDRRTIAERAEALGLSDTWEFALTR